MGRLKYKRPCVELGYYGIADGVKFFPASLALIASKFNKLGIEVKLKRKDEALFSGNPSDSLLSNQYMRLESDLKFLLNLNNLEYKQGYNFKTDFYLVDKNDIDVYSVLTAYGCSYGCYKCPNQNLPYTKRSTSIVKEEVMEVCKRVQCTTEYFEFIDNNILLRDDLEEILKVIPKGVYWGALINIVPFEEIKDKLEMLYKYGCRNLYTGLETLDEEDLNFFRKPFSGQVDRIEFLDKLREMGFNVYAFIIRGLPNCSPKKFTDLQQLLESKGIFYGISIYTVDGEYVRHPNYKGVTSFKKFNESDSSITSKNLKKIISAVAK